MIIEPLPGIVQLEMQQVEAGVLDTSSKQAAVEYAKVIAIGSEISNATVTWMDKSSSTATNVPGPSATMYLPDYPSVGDHVFVKSWAIDIVTHEDKKYYFVNLDTKGILAVVK